MKTFVYFVILLTLLLSACSAQTQPGAGHFAGLVSGTDAFIGLVTNGDQLQAYFCDGTQEAAPELWGWFRGDLNGSSFDLTNDSGDRLTGKFNADGASGTITLADGSALNFQAEPVKEPAGLYRFEETIDSVDHLTGWVVLSNGHWRGGRKSGAKLTSAASQPTGWVDPDTEPIRWVEPDTQP